MAKYLRPRRGTKTNANGQNILLKRGEIFLEFPGAIGNQAGKLIVGDGSTSYSNIKPFIESPELYIPRFNNSTYKTSSYTNDYNLSTETINQIDGSSSSTISLNDTIGIIKKALCYESNTLCATVYNVLSQKANRSTVSSNNGLLPKFNSSTLNYFRADGSWSTPPNDNTTYTIATTSKAGLVPQLPADASSVTKYLAGDAVWRVPPDTVYYFPNSTRSGLCRQFTGDSTKFLRGDNSWQVPPNDNTTYSLSMNYISNSSTEEIFADYGVQWLTQEIGSRSKDHNSIFVEFTNHGGITCTISANGTTSGWIQGVYQLTDGYTLVGARIERLGGDYKSVIPVTCLVETKNNLQGTSVAFKNKDTSASKYISGTLVEFYIRNSMT